MESRDLIFAYKKIREHLDRHLANVVLFCKKRMVRDVITFAMDLSKIEQRLKELQQAVSLVNLVGQYLPPLPKVDLDALLLKNPADNEQKADDSKADDKEFEIDMDPATVVENAIQWNDKNDMEDMEIVLDLFKDSP